MVNHSLYKIFLSGLLSLAKSELVGLLNGLFIGLSEQLSAPAKADAWANGIIDEEMVEWLSKCDEDESLVPAMFLVAIVPEFSRGYAHRITLQ